MKKMLTAIALTIAFPAVAYAQAAPKADCCKDMKDCCKSGKMDCCKDMQSMNHDGHQMKGMDMHAGHQMNGTGDHAGHDMSGQTAQQPQH